MVAALRLAFEKLTRKRILTNKYGSLWSQKVRVGIYIAVNSARGERYKSLRGVVAQFCLILLSLRKNYECFRLLRAPNVDYKLFNGHFHVPAWSVQKCGCKCESHGNHFL